MQRQPFCAEFDLRLAVTENIAPTGREQRIEPNCRTEQSALRPQIPPCAIGLGCDGGIATLARNIEPAEGGGIVTQQIVGPPEFQSERRVRGILLSRPRKVTESVLQEARPITCLLYTSRCV